MTLPYPSPSPQAGARRLDIIFVEGYTGHTVIGIHESEQGATQPVRIDLQAGLPRARACDSDRIADTIDYGAVHARLARLLGEHRFKLLEALAEEIASILVREFGATWARVRVAKPGKLAGVQAVGVEIERNAADFAPPAPGEPGAGVLSLIGAGLVPQG